MGGAVRDPSGRREVRVLLESCSDRVVDAGLTNAVRLVHLRRKGRANLQKRAEVNPEQAQQLLWFQGKEFLK